MDKSTGSKPNRKGNPQRESLHKGAVLQQFAARRGFKGWGVAKRYCRRDPFGDSFVQGASPQIRPLSSQRGSGLC